MSVVFARTRPYPPTQRLDVLAGDGVEFTLTAEEDLIGSVVAEIRRNRSDPDPLDSFLVNVVGNVATIMLPGSQSALLAGLAGVYDVQWQADENAEPVTLVQGPLFVAADVTRVAGPTPPPPFDPGYPLVESSFGADGPLTVPWEERDLIYPGYDPPDVASGEIVGSEFAGYSVMARSDLSPALLVGIRLATDWTTSTAFPSVKLFLIEDDSHWIECRYSYNGPTFEATILYVTVDEGGTHSATIVPVHEATPLPDGGALALQFDGDTVRYLIAASGDPADLVEAASNMGLVPAATHYPAFQIQSDAGVAGFFSGGIPED